MTLIPRSWPKHIRYLLIVYLQGIVLFTLLRIVLLIIEVREIEKIEGNKLGIILKAFANGFRFDTVVSCYILLIPFIILTIAAFRNIQHVDGNLRLYKIVNTIILIGYIISLFAWSSDIPYYHYFGMRLNAFAVSRFNHPEYILKMMTRDPINLVSLIVCAAVCFLYARLLRKLRINYLSKAVHLITSGTYFRKTILPSLVFILVFLIGIWGTLRPQPLQAKDAVVCDDCVSLPNQLGLNPLFTFVLSVFDQYDEKNNKLILMDENLALKNVRQYLSIPSNEKFDSPIARSISATDSVRDYNIVIVLMESMSADFLGRFGNRDNLTPHIDSLANQGWSFDHFYSSGMHTYQGIFSTLFGLPCVLRHHPMLDQEITSYSGLPNYLHAAGYQTSYFTTHEGYRDNVEKFLPANNFENFYSLEDYPKDEIEGVYGVPDHWLFHFMIDQSREMHEEGKPFFSVIMTGSNHPPYELPQNCSFVPDAENEREQMVQYADWSIGEFLNEVKSQPWFGKTVFVFLGDHGMALDKTYDVSLSFHHIPCIFYAPEILNEAKVFDQLGGQIDLTATIMGILNQPFVNNTLGIDLLKESRPFIFFSEDDKIACMNEQYIYALRNSEVETLYHYPDADLKNYLEENASLVNDMRTYLKSMMQTSMWMMKNKKVGMQIAM